MSTHKPIRAVLVTLGVLTGSALLLCAQALAAPEAPVTGPATGVAAHEATLHGELNPGSSASVRYQFSVITSGSCTDADAYLTGLGEQPLTGKGIAVEYHLTAFQPILQFLQPVPLVASTDYTYCVVASDSTGSTYGQPVTFRTLDAQPTIEGLSVSGFTPEGYSGVSPEGVSLTAQVNPENQPAECDYEYGTTPAANETKLSCEQGSTLEGSVNQKASVKLPQLLAATKYYYRLVAKNATGETKSEGEFETLYPRPQAVTGAASVLTTSEAKITGTVNPEGPVFEARYFVQYGPTTSYGQSAGYPGINVGSGETPVEVTRSLNRLTPGILFHYRIVAVNLDGTSYGQDKTFTTLANAAPAVTTSPASGITQNVATLGGTIENQGLPTFYQFQYGPDARYGTWVNGDAGSQPGTQAIALALEYLQPETVYHYRLCAGNEAGETCGQDQSFRTPGFPVTITQPSTTPLLANPSITFPTQTGAITTTTTRKLTNAQKLTNALRACAKKPKAKRAACKRQARKKYGGKTKK